MLPSRSRLKALKYTFELTEMLARRAIKAPQPPDIWITFDDGPHPIYTPSMLNTLLRHRIRATFFWVGQCVEMYPGIVQRAVDEGHFIGNHSYSHPHLPRLNRAGIEREIMRADEVLAPFQHGVKLFRPPHGDRDTVVDEVAKAAGYETVLWNLSTRDWSRPFQPQRWVHLGTFLARLTDKAVVLMHADLAGTAAHLDDFLRRLRRLGGKFKPPETLLTDGKVRISYEAFRTENLIQSTQR